MDSVANADACLPAEATVADIRAHIAEYNRDRPGIYHRCVNIAALAMAAYAVVFVLILVAGLKTAEMGRGFGAVLGLFGGAGFWIWKLVWKPLNDHQLSLRHRLFPKVFGFIDGVRYSAGQEPGFLERLKDLKLVSFTSAESDDMIAGRHGGMEFQLVEAQLVSGSGKSKQTVFKGLIFHFKLEKTFPGMLVAARRGGWWQRTMREMWRTGAPTELSSGNRRLDETHEFHSDNFAAARPIIAGPLTSVLTWLGNEWDDGNVQIALTGTDGYLMLPSTQNYFALPDMKYDVDYERDVKPLVHEMVMLLAVAHLVRRIG